MKAISGNILSFIFLIIIKYFNEKFTHISCFRLIKYNFYQTNTNLFHPAPIDATNNKAALNTNQR